MMFLLGVCGVVGAVSSFSLAMLVALAITLLIPLALWKVAKAQGDVGARLVYQPFENADGPALLHQPLDPELANLSQDARKFKAARSLRDVEPSVNLWLKRLDGTEVELPADGDEA